VGEDSFNCTTSAECIARQLVALGIADRYLARWAAQVLCGVHCTESPTSDVTATEIWDWPEFGAPVRATPDNGPLTLQNPKISKTHDAKDISAIKPRDIGKRRHGRELRVEEVANGASSTIMSRDEAHPKARFVSEWYGDPVAIAVGKLLPAHYVPPTTLGPGVLPIEDWFKIECRPESISGFTSHPHDADRKTTRGSSETI
jgi:hypothetical protein